MRLALTFYSVLRIPIADIINCAVEAENVGFHYISVAESFYRDAAIISAAVALKTRKMRLGSSVFPVSIRSPFQTAMAVSTLNELTMGRVGFIGLGVGYRDRIEKYFGVKMENPIEKMEEYAIVLKGLLSGKTFSHVGKFFSTENFPPLAPSKLDIPIFFGSSGSKMLSLAGKIADGVILNSIGTKEYFEYATATIRNSLSEAKRDKKKFEVAASIIYSVSEKHEDAIETARHDVLFYFLYPELDPVIEKTPYLDKVLGIRKTYATGNVKEALSLVTDDMVERLTVSGTEKECRQKMRKILSYGVTLPVIRVSVHPFKERKRRGVIINAIRSLSNISKIK